MRVRMLIGGAIGDVPHEPGDVLDVPDAQANRWVKAGIAEELDEKPSRRKSKED